MTEIIQEELYYINGGKLETASDWLLLGAGICFCYVAPPIGVPATIAFAVFG